MEDLKEKCEVYFSIVEDPRNYCNVKHKLVEILILVMCSILCGIDEIEKIIQYGNNKKEMLTKYFNITKIPSKATLSRVLNMIDIDKVWIAILGILRTTLKLNKKIISIDGKTIRSTEKMKSYENSLQILTAYATECGMSLGELAIYEKTNEIPVARDLIEMLDIKNSVVTLDALHCQKDTVKKIIDKKGDYVIGLKGNQKNLYADIDMYVKNIISSEYEKDKEKYSYSETIEKNRNRIEKRKCYKLNDISWYFELEKWEGLNTIFAIERTIEKENKTTVEMSYYITSLKDNPEKLMEYARKHWQIEAMHYMLDVTYNEDKCRVLSENSQKVLNKFRKMGISLHREYLKRLNSKKSTRSNMFNCLLNDKLLIDVILSDNL